MPKNALFLLKNLRALGAPSPFLYDEFLATRLKKCMLPINDEKDKQKCQFVSIV